MTHMTFSSLCRFLLPQVLAVRSRLTVAGRLVFSEAAAAHVPNQSLSSSSRLRVAETCWNPFLGQRSTVSTVPYGKSLLFELPNSEHANANASCFHTNVWPCACTASKASKVSLASFWELASKWLANVRARRAKVWAQKACKSSSSQPAVERFGRWSSQSCVQNPTLSTRGQEWKSYKVVPISKLPLHGSPICNLKPEKAFSHPATVQRANSQFISANMPSRQSSFLEICQPCPRIQLIPSMEHCHSPRIHEPFTKEGIPSLSRH